MMNKVLGIVFSPYMMVGRGVWTTLIILYLTGVIHMGMIDVTNYGINEEYIVPMLIAALIVGLLTAIGIRRYFHDKAADKKIEAGEIKTVFDLPYDKRYDFGTFVGFLFGAAGGIYAAPAIVDYVFIGAGMWTYVLVTGLAAAFLVVVITTLVHFGLRKWVINAKQYVIDTVDTVQDAVTEIKDKLDDGEVNGSVEPVVIVTGQPIQKP